MMAGLAASAFLRRGPAAMRWPLWALLLPLGAAALRGGIQPIAKVGFVEVPSPMFAALIMSATSVVVLAALQMVRIG